MIHRDSATASFTALYPLETVLFSTVVKLFKSIPFCAEPSLSNQVSLGNPIGCIKASPSVCSTMMGNRASDSITKILLRLWLKNDSVEFHCSRPVSGPLFLEPLAGCFFGLKLDFDRLGNGPGAASAVPRHDIERVGRVKGKKAQN